jgi:hypothetical protein
LSEQYCFGVQMPFALRVNALKRRPSPPAKTTTQIFRRLPLKSCPWDSDEVLSPSQGGRDYKGSGNTDIQTIG